MKMLVAAVASLCLLEPSALADTNAKQVEGTIELWSAPGSFARALLASPNDIPGLSVVGSVEADKIDEALSSCAARVFRPRSNDKVYTESNAITCDVYDTEGHTAALTLDLKAVAIERWGNNADEAHWTKYGLGRVFQVLNEPFNLPLYGALRGLSRAGHPNMDHMYNCDNVGKELCSNTYSLKKENGGGKSYLNCTVDTEGATIYRTRCTFFFP